MTKVFIGGSRRVTRLNSQVRKRLDKIMENQFSVLIGDATGADKAIQQYLDSREYELVEVFCTEGICRNNVGHWKVRAIPAPAGGKRNFEYYAAKDRQMAVEASIGLMLWDGESRGTLSNMLRLLEQGKKVVTYVAPLKTFKTLRNMADWENLLSMSDKGRRLAVEETLAYNGLRGRM